MEQEHIILFVNRTYGELKREEYPSLKDPYKIMASLNPKMREAMLHNPSGYDDSEDC